MAKSDSQKNTEAWRDINWRKAERYVWKLQKRIFAASRPGDIKLARMLQRTLMRSWYNKVLAVRRVTVENQGKKTAGVDGVKSLPPEARLELVGELKLTGKSKPRALSVDTQARKGRETTIRNTDGVFTLHLFQ